MFTLCQAHQFIHARGLKRQLRSGTAASLESDVNAFFQNGGAAGGAAVLVGALPFEVRAPVFLYQPEQFHVGSGLGPLAHVSDHVSDIDVARLWAPFQVVSSPSPSDYAAMVRQALNMIEKGDLTKVVLSRSLRVDAAMPVDPLLVAERLTRDSNVTTFMMPLPIQPGDSPAMLVGATPELLVSRAGAQVTSHPLAGSAPRQPERSHDEAIAQALLHSDKDRREHMLVVEAILDILAPYCVSLGTPAGTTLHSTTTMWHLGTKIEGVLKSDAPSSAGLAALLHPTPAVGGSPRSAALEAIRTLESHDRGFYAGAIGWNDAQGDGEWYVTLRCAEICDARLTLQAGAGIVAGSEPDAEVAETRAKFQAMLRAIGMDQTEELLEVVL